MRQLEIAQRRTARELRRAFRAKQRQFQNSMYLLNSRLNPDFPRPPYALWRMDDGPSIGKTTLTGKIFLFNIAMFGLQTLYPKITSLGAKRSDLIMEGRQLHRLLTPVFLHGGIGHLIANGYSLKSMGASVEKSFGGPRMLATYLASGVAGNVLSAIQSPNPAVGASGAIFGLVGAYYAFLSRNGDLFGRTGDAQKGALLETVGFNAILGLTNPMIDNWGHLGGFIGGVGMSYLIGPRLYVARVPLGDVAATGAFGAGRVVVDRPAVTFRMPEAAEEAWTRGKDAVLRLGRRAAATVRGLRSGEEREYYFDGTVDLDTAARGDGGTVYRTLRGDDVSLEGARVGLTPADGLRQDASALDPAATSRRRRTARGRQRRVVPGAGRSIRPRYSHMYR